MNGAEFLCQALEEKGVDLVFGLFGDIQTQFAHALGKSKIRWIGVHNEKCGGFMADIYSRVCQKPGIIFSTLGPGATNLTSALANATSDRSSLIAISDQVPLDECRLETHQYVDLTEAFHPKTGITKQTFFVQTAEEIPSVFDQVFQIATSEPKGAVHISIPADIFGAAVKKKKIRKIFKRKKDHLFHLSTLSFDKLLKILNSKKKGLVIAGGSLERQNAQGSFRTFVGKYQLPVLTTFRGKNALESDHPQCLGTISRHLGNVLKDIIKEVSFILTIGYDYNEGVKPSLWQWKKIGVYNIDCFDNRVKGIFEPPSLFGDLNKILERLSSQALSKRKKSFDYQSMKERIEKKVKEALDVTDPSLHPGRIIEAINNAYHEDTVIICDVGLNKYYSGLLLKADRGKQIIFSNGQSSMAFTSGAMGAKLAAPKKDVVVLVGDGGFLMDPQEIITAAKYHQAITWIIFNNGGLGLVEQAQLKNGEKSHGVKFAKVFFAKFARACGIEGIKIKGKDNLSDVLTKVRKAQKPTLIDVPVEYTER